MRRDYYAVLGIAATAGPREVRRAYQRLARQYSPDVNFWDERARELFEEIAEAFRVLGDPAARQMYDLYGSVARADEALGEGRRGDDAHQRRQVPRRPPRPAPPEDVLPRREQAEEEQRGHGHDRGPVSGMLMKVPLTTAAFALVASVASADPLNCVLTAYKAMPGLTATVAGQALAVTWDGDEGAELRMRFGIEGGTPTIQDLAVRRKGGAWATLAANVRPEFRVVSGRRRISEQQLGPLRSWGQAITPERAAREKWDTSFFKMTPEMLEKGKWDPFWDDPLFVPGVAAGRRRLQVTQEKKPCDSRSWRWLAHWSPWPTRPRSWPPT